MFCAQATLPPKRVMRGSPNGANRLCMEGQPILVVSKARKTPREVRNKVADPSHKKDIKVLGLAPVTKQQKKSSCDNNEHPLQKPAENPTTFQTNSYRRRWSRAQCTRVSRNTDSELSRLKHIYLDLQFPKHFSRQAGKSSGQRFKEKSRFQKNEINKNVSGARSADSASNSGTTKPKSAPTSAKKRQSCYTHSSQAQRIHKTENFSLPRQQCIGQMCVVGSTKDTQKSTDLVVCDKTRKVASAQQSKRVDSCSSLGEPWSSTHASSAKPHATLPTTSHRSGRIICSNSKNTVPQMFTLDQQRKKAGPWKDSVAEQNFHTGPCLDDAGVSITKKSTKPRSNNANAFVKPDILNHSANPGSFKHSPADQGETVINRYRHENTSARSKKVCQFSPTKHVSDFSKDTDKVNAQYKKIINNKSTDRNGNFYRSAATQSASTHGHRTEQQNSKSSLSSNTGVITSYQKSKSTDVKLNSYQSYVRESSPVVNRDKTEAKPVHSLHLALSGDGTDTTNVGSLKFSASLSVVGRDIFSAHPVKPCPQKKQLEEEHFPPKTNAFHKSHMNKVIEASNTKVSVPMRPETGAQTFKLDVKTNSSKKSADTISSRKREATAGVGPDVNVSKSCSLGQHQGHDTFEEARNRAYPRPCRSYANSSKIKENKAEQETVPYNSEISTQFPSASSWKMSRDNKSGTCGSKQTCTVKHPEGRPVNTETYTKGIESEGIWDQSRNETRASRELWKSPIPEACGQGTAVRIKYRTKATGDSAADACSLLKRATGGKASPPDSCILCSSRSQRKFTSSTPFSSRNSARLLHESFNVPVNAVDRAPHQYRHGIHTKLPGNETDILTPTVIKTKGVLWFDATNGKPNEYADSPDTSDCFSECGEGSDHKVLTGVTDHNVRDDPTNVTDEVFKYDSTTSTSKADTKFRNDLSAATDKDFGDDPVSVSGKTANFRDGTRKTGPAGSSSTAFRQYSPRTKRTAGSAGGDNATKNSGLDAHNSTPARGHHEATQKRPCSSYCGNRIFENMRRRLRRTFSAVLSPLQRITAPDKKNQNTLQIKQILPAGSRQSKGAASPDTGAADSSRRRNRRRNVFAADRWRWPSERATGFEKLSRVRSPTAIYTLKGTSLFPRRRTGPALTSTPSVSVDTAAACPGPVVHVLRSASGFRFHDVLPAAGSASVISTQPVTGDRLPEALTAEQLERRGLHVHRRRAEHVQRQTSTVSGLFRASSEARRGRLQPGNGRRPDDQPPPAPRTEFLQAEMAHNSSDGKQQQRVDSGGRENHWEGAQLPSAARHKLVSLGEARKMGLTCWVQGKAIGRRLASASRDRPHGDDGRHPDGPELFPAPSAGYNISRRRPGHRSSTCV